MSEDDIAFEVGQLVEARSFLQGYRGAWFRCKITKIRRRQDELWLALEYYDFPDEKIRWTKVYQKPPKFGGANPKGPKRQLMVRPQFPPVYRQSQMPDVSTFVQVVVNVDHTWKVGDLVDWWCTGCYWSGRITKILEDQKFQIELHPPPVGEGSYYIASIEDLRPSLDWSLDEGWSVAISKDTENGQHCAQLVKPVLQGDSTNLMDQPVDEGGNDVQVTAGASLEPYSDSHPSSRVRDASLEVLGTTAGMGRCTGKSSEKLMTDGNFSLNLMSSDTTEAAILDMAELVIRVKWIKSILESENPLLDTSRPAWKFLERCESSTPK